MSFPLGVVKAGFGAGVEALAGVLTGDGAFGAGVSVPPNEKPPVFDAGVVVAGAGLDTVEFLDASLSVSAGFAVAAPPNEKPPKYRRNIMKDQKKRHELHEFPRSNLL